MKDNLVATFEKAGLSLELHKAPLIGVGNDDVFQMDIRRKIRGCARSEVFRIFKGNADNTVQVMNSDPKLKQLILLVKEPSREIVLEDNLRPRGRELTELMRRAAANGRTPEQHIRKEFADQRRRIVSLTGSLNKGFKIKVASKTPSHTRYFLCGVDERQLFIAQVARHITTVAQAHKELKGARVETAEGRAAGRTLRQGEWFLMNLTPEEERALADALRKKETAIQKNVNIGAATGFRNFGKPHIAEEFVVVTAKVLSHGFAVNRSRDCYVRGKITHPDHQTVKLKSWRRVLKNNEGGSGDSSGPAPGSSGIFWID